MSKRVVHICTSKLSYKILLDKLILLSEKGYEVHIVSSSEGTEHEEQYVYKLQEKGIQLHEVAMERSIRAGKDWLAFRQLVRLLRKIKPDIVHTHNAKAGFLGRVAAHKARVPIIIHTVHGLPFFAGQSRLEYYTYLSLELFAAKYCNYLCSQNDEDLKTLRKYLPTEKLHYEGNGVHLPLLDRISQEISLEELDEYKMKYDIPEGKTLLLVAARLEPVKDHALLFEALQQVVKRGTTNILCLLAGNGHLETELEQQVTERGLQPYVKFLGYQDNIYHWIKLSDLIVLSSQKEGIPRILMESMAFGKPIVATDVKGTKELVVHEETGLLSPYRNPDELAKNLIRLIENAELQAKLGLKGRERIEQHFTEEVVVERISKWYQATVPYQKPLWKKIVHSVLLVLLIGFCLSIVYGYWKVSQLQPETHFQQKIHPVLTSDSIFDRRHNQAQAPAQTQSTSQPTATSQNHSSASVVPFPSNHFNVLLLGIDAREKENSRTDVIMVAHVNVKTKQVNIVSVPRDTQVQINGIGKTKINHAHILGEIKGGSREGTMATSQAVSDFLDIPINYYIKTNFQGFIHFIDKIGGIDVNLPHAVRMTYEPLEIPAGDQHLDGELALKLIRERYSRPDGEYGRQADQMLVMKAVVSKLLKPENIPEIYHLLQSIRTDILDTNFTDDDLVSLALLFKGLTGEQLSYTQIHGKSGKALDPLVNQELYYIFPDEKAVQEISETFLQEKE
ncbi:LCP family protein [Brevibacillus sp. SYSU BS000544]|uniref:LCP family glycopolymer transferase n=1 Tax=Brevibacillus sp. SYSU BS000544 TaxID=3416443 RepID=UPI003CE52D91